MLLTPHLLTGVAIATKIPNPVLGLIFAFLSHYFLDCFPQREYSIENIKERRWYKSFLDFSKVFLDISFGVLLIVFLSENNSLIFVAALLAILPDGLTVLGLILPKNKLIEVHDAFHQKINSFFGDKKISLFWGIFTQLLVILIAIFFLL